MSATVAAIQGRVPAGARGEAMGLHGTALLIGGAVAGPAAGAVVDAHGPVWAFAAAGALGLVLVLIAFPFWRDARRPAAAEPVSAEPVSASL
jgi:sugar phosphate permease